MYSKNKMIDVTMALERTKVLGLTDPQRRTMLRRSLAAIVACAVDGCPPVWAADEAAGILRDGHFYSAALAANFHYKIYLPADYAHSGLRYPVLYLLHGRGDNFQAWSRIKPLLDALISSGKISPCLVVMPDAPSSNRASYYVNSAYDGTGAPGKNVETACIEEMLPHIDASYRSDARRLARAIGGYSMGGYGAMRYALVYPELFSAAIVLSPASYVPVPPVDSSTRSFGAFGRGQSLFVEEIYTAKNYPALLPHFAEKKLASHFFVGAGDDEYKNPPPDQAHDIDLESHVLFSSLVRTPHMTAELRIVNGSHDWSVWDPLFREGLIDIFTRLSWARPAGGTPS